MSNLGLRSLVVGVFLCVGLVAASHAQGLAWKLTHKDSEKEAYLLGAFHMANSSFYPLSPTVLDGYAQADVLVVEADEDLLTPEQTQSLVERYGKYPEGEHYRDHLPENLVEQIEAMFVSLGLTNPDQLFGSYRPGLLGVTLAAVQAQALGYSADYGIDSYFLQKARYRKPIEEIEGLAFQIELLSKLPLTDQNFSDALVNMTDFEADWKNMEQAWKAGDAQGLYAQAIGDTLRDFPSLSGYYQTLFFDRNKVMADYAQDCIQTKVCFIVVGAGHLVGPNSVIELLEQRGFSASQLK